MIERKDADPREALADEGLLSPEIETWRQIYVDNYRDWFKLARELNRYAVSLFQDHQDAGEGGPANAAAPTAVRIFGRALNASPACPIAWNPARRRKRFTTTSSAGAAATSC